MKLWIGVMVAMLPDVEQEIRPGVRDEIQLVRHRYEGDAAALYMQLRQDAILIYAETPASAREIAQSTAREKWPEAERWTAHAVTLVEVPRAELVEALRRVSDDDPADEPTAGQERVM